MRRMTVFQVFILVAILLVTNFLTIPGALAVNLRLPFLPGETWWCSQGNAQGPTHTGSLHYAWDFNWGSGWDDFGKPVCAPAGGVVNFAGWAGGGWGNVVIIDYGSGEFGRLAHLDMIFVNQGAGVVAGQVIGLCGGSGGWSPHLHYQTENSNGISIPSVFEECGVPLTGGYYTSQNSQMFCDAFNRYGGADHLGQPQNDIHWYYEYTPQMSEPSCLIQDYNGGDYGWCALVYDATGGAHEVHLLRTGFWGTWRTLGTGGPCSPLGQVINSEYAYQGTARQDFTFGYMVWRNGNSEVNYYADTGSVAPGYGSLGYTQDFIDYYNENGAGSTFGQATSVYTGNPGVQTWGNFQIQYFRGGSNGDCAIVLNPANGDTAHVLRSGFFSEYMARWFPGSAGSFIGAPTSDPFSANNDRGVRQNFEYGYYMVEQGGSVRVYAQNGSQIDPEDLAIPEAVPCYDDGEQTCDRVFHFSWPVPQGSQDFYLQVSQDPNFATVDWESWLNSTTGDWAFTGDGGKYYYGRVRRQGTNGVVSNFGARSDGIQIGCGVSCWDDGVFSNDPVVHFSYPVLENIDQVHMQVSETSDFSVISWESDLPATGDWAFTGCMGNTYYARVKLCEGGHWGNYGDSSDGITIGMTFPCIDDGDFSTDPVFHVFVEEVPGMVKAYFQISTDSLFPAHSIVWEGETTYLDKAFAGCYGETYYARGKVLDTGGHWSGYGAASDGLTVGGTTNSWDDGDVSTDQNFIIYYEPLYDAEQIYIQVATDLDFQEVFWEGEVPITGSKAFFGEYGQTYYGRTKLQEGGHWGSFGEPSDGITIGLTPTIYDDGDYSADNEIAFDIKIIPGFENLEIQIATDPDFENIVHTDTGLWERYTFSGEKDEEYFARVRGAESGVWGEFSNTTDGILSASESWVGDEGEVSADRVVNFNFDSYIGVENTYCQVAKNPEFTDLVWSGWLNGNSGILRFVGKPGDYLYARASLRDNNGQVCEIGQASDGILIRKKGPLQAPLLSNKPALVDPNLLSNNSFENGLTNWILESHLGYSQFYTDSAGAYHLDNSGVVYQAEVSEEFYQVQLKQVGFPLENGEDYWLSFIAKAEQPRLIYVMVMQDEDPWQNYGCFEPIWLTTDWQRFQIDFTSLVTDQQTARLAFCLGETAETVWFDNVRLAPQF